MYHPFHIFGPPFVLVQVACGCFGIFLVVSASGACFWWLGALSNMKRPVVKLFVFTSKISIAFSTCLSKSSAENHPLRFVPALNTMHASLTNTMNIAHHRSKKTHSSPWMSRPHSNVNMSDIISNGPSPFFCGVAFWLGWVHSVFLRLFA